MPIIICQVDKIWHNKLTTMMVEEQWLLAEICRSIIQMHLAKNVYFSMAKQLTAFNLWEKLQMIYMKKSSSSKLILIWQLYNMKMRELELETSHANRSVANRAFSQSLNFEEKACSCFF